MFLHLAQHLRLIREGRGPAAALAGISPLDVIDAGDFAWIHVRIGRKSEEVSSENDLTRDSVLDNVWFVF